MKNKIIISALLAATAVLSVSCEKDFDAKIYGRLSTDKFPASASDFESYVIQCYEPFIGNWDGELNGGTAPFYEYNKGLVCFMTKPSDETAVPSGNWFGPKVFNGDFTDYERTGRWAADMDAQPNYLEKIRDVTRYTRVLSDVQNAKEGILTPERQKQLEGEVRLCRGILMYYILNIYGPVHMIVDPAELDNPDIEKDWTRPSLDKVCQDIMDDFEFAAANMVETQPQDQQGRYTADYARVFIMRHALNEGYHMSGWYQKAYDVYTQFNGKYALYTEGENPYRELFSVKHEWNSEVIMALPITSDADLEKSNGNGSCMANYILPMDVAKYDDQGNPTPFVNWGNWCNQEFPVSPKFYDSFEEGDLRQKSIVNRYYSGWGRGWIGPEQLGNLWQGYILNKYPIETATTYQGNDYILARWADVMLMRAEADVRLNNAVSDEAVDLVNQVRARAGLGGMPDTATSSAENFLDFLCQERSHELYFEDCRKIDLIRFNKYYTTMSALGRTPTSEYYPLPNYAMDEAEAEGQTVERYWFRDNYDGPKTPQK